MVTNEQLYLAIGLPMLFNATLIGLVIALSNAKFGRVDARFEFVEARFKAVDARFDAVDAKFNAVDAKFDAVGARFDAVDARFDALEVQLRGINQRLDHMQEMWRSELRRVEEILDARLRHLEER